VKANYDLIPISINIVQETAELRALFRIKLPDALILATAKISQADYLISNDITIQKKAYIPILAVEECIKN
jgi:predicted nucleic acid-binding protein